MKDFIAFGYIIILMTSDLQQKRNQERDKLVQLPFLSFWCVQDFAVKNLRYKAFIQLLCSIYVKDSYLLIFQKAQCLLRREDILIMAFNLVQFLTASGLILVNIQELLEEDLLVVSPNANQAIKDLMYKTGQVQSLAGLFRWCHLRFFKYLLYEYQFS